MVKLRMRALHGKKLTLGEKVVILHQRLHVRVRVLRERDVGVDEKEVAVRKALDEACQLGPGRVAESAGRCSTVSICCHGHHGRCGPREQLPAEKRLSSEDESAHRICSGF